MSTEELLSKLFREEYRKIVSVLCYRFGIHHIEIAEDIVSDTFLSATETWHQKGLPENAAAWLYTVAKNKTKNFLKHHAIFESKLSPEIQRNQEQITAAVELNLSEKNIADSQLAMIFAICNPVNPRDAQVSLALNLLCGFGIPEISEAFLTNKEVIYKRIQRAKQKLKEADVKIEPPNDDEIEQRLGSVMTTLYLLFSEGYYSSAPDVSIRRDFCAEAMRLTFLLTENASTNKPEVNALLSLMCFHSSRFDARLGPDGQMILYDDQDPILWNQELLTRGAYYLSKAATGNQLTKYHLEAAIAYWHTQKENTGGKWEHILELYDQLLIIDNSPVAALNRTYALAQVSGKQAAIVAAEVLNLNGDRLYFSLLGHLYTDLDDEKALLHYETALSLAKNAAERTVIQNNIDHLKGRK